MSVSKKDIKLLIALLGILALVLVYFLVYKPLGEKTTVFEAENATLGKRVQELQALADQEPFFKEEIVRFTAENNEILNRFPADVRSEDAIMLATEMGYASPAVIFSVSMEDAEEVYRVGERAAEILAEQAATQPAIAQPAPATTDPASTDPAATTVTPTEVAPATAEQVLYGRKVQINYKCNYDEMKRSIRYLYESTDRRILGAINATYDMSTGLIDVALGTGLYYMTGTEREYVAPNIPYIPQGTENIFGTLTIPTEPVNVVENED